MGIVYVFQIEKHCRDTNYCVQCHRYQSAELAAVGVFICEFIVHPVAYFLFYFNIGFKESNARREQRTLGFQLKRLLYNQNKTSAKKIDSTQLTQICSTYPQPSTL
jgi:hypothetical protein